MTMLTFAFTNAHGNPHSATQITQMIIKPHILPDRMSFRFWNWFSAIWHTSVEGQHTQQKCLHISEPPK